jgi:hypothetical protein
VAGDTEVAEGEAGLLSATDRAIEVVCASEVGAGPGPGAERGHASAPRT